MYDRRPYAGSGAYLVCPVTQFTGQKIESQFSNHRGRLEATNSVMQLAGRLLCGNCRYGDMTQAEFAYDQADYLSAQAERNDAQADLIESQQRLRALTGEQQPPYLLPHERQPD